MTQHADIRFLVLDEDPRFQSAASELAAGSTPTAPLVVVAPVASVLFTRALHPDASIVAILDDAEHDLVVALLAGADFTVPRSAPDTLSHVAARARELAVGRAGSAPRGADLLDGIGSLSHSLGNAVTCLSTRLDLMGEEPDSMASELPATLRESRRVVDLVRELSRLCAPLRSTPRAA